MAVTITEFVESGKLRVSMGNQSQWEEQFTIRGAAAKADAATAIAEYLAPRQYQDLGTKRLLLDTIDIDPMSDDSLGIYRATARWVDQQRAANGSNNSGGGGSWPPTPGTGNGLDDSDTWVDGTQISVTTENIQQFFSPAGKYSAYGTATYAVDLAGAIEFDGEIVKGASVPTPKATWSEEFVRGEGWFAPSKLKGISEFVGKTNKTEYRLFPAGSLLILGIEGGFRTVNSFVYKVTYGYSPNKTDLTFGEGTDAITVPTKKGWQYLWTRSEKYLREDIGLIVPIVRAVYVHDIFDEVEFADLVEEFD